MILFGVLALFTFGAVGLIYAAFIMAKEADRLMDDEWPPNPDED